MGTAVLRQFLVLIAPDGGRVLYTHGTGSKTTNFMRTQLYLIDWFAKHVHGGGRP